MAVSIRNVGLSRNEAFLSSAVSTQSVVNKEIRLRDPLSCGHLPPTVPEEIQQIMGDADDPFGTDAAQPRGVLVSNHSRRNCLPTSLVASVEGLSECQSCRSLDGCSSSFG